MQRQDDYIKMDLQEMGWKVMDWINLALNRYKWWEVNGHLVFVGEQECLD
jgi:hypothetical protein